MNTLSKTSKIINFRDRNIISFIFKECDFSLLKVAKLAYLNTDGKTNYLKDKENIIEIPINIIFKEAIKTDLLNKPIKANKVIVKSKSTIENICNCLLPIAKINYNRFIFKNLDLNLTINKILFSRLILNLCYQLLTNSKKYSAIEIISYLEKKQYIIEFTTEYHKTEKNTEELKTLNPILKQLKSSFSYEELPTGETTFKLIMPYENTRS